MSKTGTKRIVVFIVVFGSLALFINNARNRRPERNAQATSVLSANQQQQQSDREAQQRVELEKAATARKAAEEAAAQHANYLARYLNSDTTRKPGAEMLAIVVASETGKLNSAVSTALSHHFKSGTVEAVSSFFTPEFVSDGLFNEVFNGSTVTFSKLDLAHSLDAVLLARQTVQYSKDPSLENVITANMQLEVVLSSVAKRGQLQTWTFTANGAGFTTQEARQLAEERLIKQIANDKNMLLGAESNKNHSHPTGFLKKKLEHLA